MTPTFINTELSDTEQKKIVSAVNKSFSDANMFSFESWPTHNVVHFKSMLGWYSIMLDKKLKVIKVSDVRSTLGKIKMRLDLYNDKKFVISHIFGDVIEARKYATHHFNYQKENGYSTSFLEKLKYSLNNIVTI